MNSYWNLEFVLRDQKSTLILTPFNFKNTRLILQTIKLWEISTVGKILTTNHNSTHTYTKLNLMLFLSVCFSSVFVYFYLKIVLFKDFSVDLMHFNLIDNKKITKWDLLARVCYICSVPQVWRISCWFITAKLRRSYFMYINRIVGFLGSCAVLLTTEMSDPIDGFSGKLWSRIFKSAKTCIWKHC